jgi:hypothetical protein
VSLELCDTPIPRLFNKTNHDSQGYPGATVIKIQNSKICVTYTYIINIQWLEVAWYSMVPSQRLSHFSTCVQHLGWIHAFVHAIDQSHFVQGLFVLSPVFRGADTTATHKTCNIPATAACTTRTGREYMVIQTGGGCQNVCFSKLCFFILDAGNFKRIEISEPHFARDS